MSLETELFYFTSSQEQEGSCLATACAEQLDSVTLLNVLDYRNNCSSQFLKLIVIS
jgi:hypothetical protein